MPDGADMIFRVAAGPRIGFGHLVRAVSLSRTMGTTPVVSLRGGATARAAARRLGCLLTDLPATDAMTVHAPKVLVVDEPRASAAEGWVVAAHRHDVPVAAIVDNGVGAHDTDLVIDGGVRTGPETGERTRCLRGPRYMVLDPIFLTTRRRRRRQTNHGTVAIALGGGAHARYAKGVAAELGDMLGTDRVRVAPGFAGRHSTGAENRQTHTALLADADVALVGGGVGLYEACCLGTPTVAVAVTPAQRGAIRTFARLGAVVDAGSLNADDSEATSSRLARTVQRLLEDRLRRAHLTFQARRLVDGRGSLRVATAIQRLAGAPCASVGGVS